METNIVYADTKEAWAGYVPYIKAIIERHSLRSVCDIGGGANPALDFEYINSLGIDYSVLDISASELEKAPSVYKKVCADIAAADFSLENVFDLAFSQMLAEHVIDGGEFHRNIFKSLVSGGYAIHFFPTLYAFPFLVNRLVPEYLADRLLNILAPRNRYQHEKFPAYYDWCRGPTGKQISRFVSLGYEVVEYRGFFGHAGYYNRIGPVKAIHEALSSWLLRHPMPLLTSYAYVVLRKP
jgi:hypothetical protein